MFFEILRLLLRLAQLEAGDAMQSQCSRRVVASPGTTTTGRPWKTEWG